VNGIEISTHSLNDSTVINAREPKGIKKRGDLRTQTSTIEETKCNFFDPKPAQDLQLFELPEKPEEDKILEAKVDPLEWKLELDSVFRDLNNIEKELEVLRKEGGSDEDFEECRRHIELIIDLCADIRDSSHHQVRSVFSETINSLEEELGYIRKNEIRMNQ